MGSRHWTAERKRLSRQSGHERKQQDKTKMTKSAVITFCLFTSVLSQNNRLQSFSREGRQEVDVVEPEELSLFARLVGEDTQARVIESISTWARDKAKENPGCVERFVCETYKTGETMSGLPYLMRSLTNAAVSFMVAEQFGDVMEMEAITRAAKLGRTIGSCHRMECPVLDGQLRTVTDYLAGFEEMLGYIVNSVSTSLG